MDEAAVADEVLVAEGVRKSYGDVVALDDVSLAVPEGEVFGLIGPNGAGKTTLVRALTGTTTVEGTVSVLGDPPDEVDPQRLGLLPQSFAPASRLTPRELLRYYAGLYESARDPDAVLRDVGLSDDADRWYEQLSGGQQRRLCVGTALVNDPDVLFLDEPTTGIDPAGRRAMWRLVEDLADGGTTVLLTSHSMAEVERLADRVGLLNEGELVAVGEPAVLVAEHGGDSRLVVRLADEASPTDPSPDAGEADDTGGVGDAGGPAIERAGRALVDAGYQVDADAETGELVVRAVAATDLGAAVDALESSGASYEALVWRQPGLEDVYLRLTGEAFEEELAAGVGGSFDGDTGEDEPTEREVPAPGGVTTGEGDGR
jgi:ABC-2 type transport system ATP-binding protein